MIITTYRPLNTLIFSAYNDLRHKVGECHLDVCASLPPYLYNFKIYPDYRGKGHSGKLLDAVIDHVDGDIRLHVAEDNVRALNIYYKKGFVIKERDNGFLTMVKK